MQVTDKSGKELIKIGTYKVQKKCFEELLYAVTYLQQYYIQYIVYVVGNILMMDYFLIEMICYRRFFYTQLGNKH